MDVGSTIDSRVSDPVLKRNTPMLGARLGATEMQLLALQAKSLGTTRSDLARRLIVKGLLELLDQEVAEALQQKSRGSL